MIPPEGTPIPTLRTERLVLRPFSPSDAHRIQELAGSEDVASTTLTIPHPYEDGLAEAWIEGHAEAWEDGQRLTLAVTTDADGVVGAMGLDLAPDHERAELGYWIGVPYWNRGFATEAARAMLDLGFGELGLHRIVARHFPRNPASGRVLRKLGMVHEGTQREHVRRWDRWEDLECYGILASEWRCRGDEAGRPADEAISERRRRWIAAIHAGDADAFVATLTEDAVWLPAGRAAIVGKERIRDWLREPFERYRYDYAVTDPRVRIAGRWAVEVARFRTRAETRTGEAAPTHEGTYTMLWRREPSRGWRIERYVDHTADGSTDSGEE